MISNSIESLALHAIFAKHLCMQNAVRKSKSLSFKRKLFALLNHTYMYAEPTKLINMMKIIKFNLYVIINLQILIPLSRLHSKFWWLILVSKKFIFSFSGQKLKIQYN